MKIAILGTGNVGTSLGGALVRENHQVKFGSRTPGSGGDRVYGLGKDVTAGNLKDAVAFGEVVVLAVPYAAVKETVSAAGGPAAFKGKTVVDATNPMGKDGPAVAPGTSAAEEIQRLVPGSAVVKAFNTTFAEHMRLGRIGPNRILLPVAGDDAQAKKTVLDLANGIGFEALDAGPLANARNLEALAFQMIHWGYGAKLGSGIALGLLRKK